MSRNLFGWKLDVVMTTLYKNEMGTDYIEKWRLAFAKWAYDYLKRKKMTQRKLAPKFNWTEGHLSNVLTAKKTVPDENERRAISKIIGLNYYDMIEMGESINIRTKQPSHRDIIAQFQDKAWAAKINSMLVELEQLDPHQKAVIEEYLEFKLSRIQKNKTPKKAG